MRRLSPVLGTLFVSILLSGCASDSSVDPQQFAKALQAQEDDASRATCDAFYNWRTSNEKRTAGSAVAHTAMIARLSVGADAVLEEAAQNLARDTSYAITLPEAYEAAQANFNMLDERCGQLGLDPRMRVR